MNPEAPPTTNNRPSSLSAVLPAFNEEDIIRRTVEKALDYLPKHADMVEIIVVNDGSRDRTREICDELAAAHQRVRVFHHPTNLGYGAALKTGIQAARADLIFFTDSDGQFDLEEFPMLLKWSDTHNIVAGYRGKRSDHWLRLVNAWGWNVLVRLVLGIRIRDIDCAFKLFHRRVFDRVQIRSVGAMVNTEILAQAERFGMSIKEVRVSHHPRLHGAPTGARPGVIVKAFLELFHLWGKLRLISRDQRGLFSDVTPLPMGDAGNGTGSRNENRD